MRIAIDGTQSTGKTTLFEALRKHGLAPFSFFGEAARELGPQLGIKAARDWTDVFASTARHLEFLRSLYLYQTRREAAAKQFIVDGSRYKILAYARAFGFALTDVTERPGDICYELIVYCPPDIAFEADGFRYEDKRSELAEELQSLYCDLHRGALITARGPTTERLVQVQSALESSQSAGHRNGDSH